MRKHILLITALLLVAVALPAQNRNVARKHFLAGEYAEAKPMFEKLLARYPQNSEYNFWYAACCYETADTAVSDSAMQAMLEFAASRKITNAYRYLGDISARNGMYNEAIGWYEDFVDASKDKELCDAYRVKLTAAEKLYRMVRSTEKVCVVDSFVVDKGSFLSAYRMGRDVGRLSSAASFFGRKGGDGGYLSETERGTDIYYSMFSETDSLLKLYHSSKVGDEWSRPVPFSGFDTKGNDNYPFMLADGVTLYFASDGEGSIGGYDIFVTRYDSESGRFLRPDNIGMPFNSTANDYMMAVNEIANLGWFASDRFQPEGKVCVYVFVPNPSKELYDASALTYEQLYDFSLLRSIAATQGDADVMRKARQQLTMLMYEEAGEEKSGDFLFVIDNATDYTRLSDFKSAEARRLFQKWQERVAAYRKESALLEKHRENYISLPTARKASLAREIEAMEKRMDNEYYMLQVLEYEVRRLEHEKLFK